MHNLRRSSKFHLKRITTVLTRMGKGCKSFILADPMQTDLRSENIQGGFSRMTEVFSDEESLNMGIYVFKFSEEDIMRSELIKFLIKKLKEENKDER